jgi:hypothetical protein
VLAYYEQLSEVKKKEHDEKYPEYCFQPMKRVEKDHIHAERQAIKEEAPATCRQKTKMCSGTQPLFMNKTQFCPAGPSLPLLGSSTPGTSLEGGQSLLLTQSEPTPPGDHPTLYNDHSPLLFNGHSHHLMITYHQGFLALLYVTHPFLPLHLPCLWLHPILVYLNIHFLHHIGNLKWKNHVRINKSTHYGWTLVLS